MRCSWANIAFAASLAIIFAGCSAFTGHGKEIEEFDNRFKSDSCDISIEKNKVDKKDDLVLSANEAAAILRKCKDYNASNYYFDKAESGYKFDVDEKGVVHKTGDEVSSALVNENVLDYEGFYYERVMTNLYKALNFMSQGKMEDARVEINRALDRQRRAKELYAKEIEEATDDLKKQSQEGSANQDPNLKSNTDSAIDDRLDELGEFETLPDFVNPFALYLGGAFFFCDGDYTKSADLFNEAARMQPNNDEIKKAAKISKKFANSFKKKDKYVFVIYENGKIIGREETKFDFPFFIINSKVPVISASYTKLTDSIDSFEHLDVNGEQTEVVSDMDAVVKTEYKKRMPVMITRAVTRAISKALASYAINSVSERAGGWFEIAAKLGTGIYTAATNHSDVRYWSSLPKNFEALMLPNQGGELDITADAGDGTMQIANIKLTDGQNAIIYIKSFSPDSVSVHQIYF